LRDAAPAAATDTAGAAPARGGAMAEWRRNGAGSQILADLGLGKLRVLGTPRKQVGLAGFGLEVVEYVAP
jgi:3,4-dihydroxy 2-butanone 4-phosphate synthase/GTP cyclohydrolase II